MLGLPSFLAGKIHTPQTIQHGDEQDEQTQKMKIRTWKESRTGPHNTGRAWKGMANITLNASTCNQFIEVVVHTESELHVQVMNFTDNTWILQIIPEFYR